MRLSRHHPPDIIEKGPNTGMIPLPYDMPHRRAFRFALTAAAAFMLAIAVYGCARMHGHEKTGTAQGALSPFAMCASRDGAKLYIAAHTANRVLVFDTAARRVTAAFDIPGRPTGLALSGDGGRLYVTAGVAPGYVYVLDSETGAALDRIQTGHSPCSPVTVPGDTTLYVLNRFDNSMSIIDLRTSRQIVATPMLREPVAAEATPDGRYIVIANQLPSGERIYDYVTDGGILMIGSYISSGYFSGNREAYASSGVVLVFDTRHRRLAELIKLPNGSDRKSVV